MYLRDFPKVPYRFGNEVYKIDFPNLSTYVDIVDQLRHTIGFYRELYVPNGERPDTLSFRLYGQSEYYWTFFLLNNSLREHGWPLDDRDVRSFVQGEFPNTAFTTTDLPTLCTNFFPGQSLITQAGETVEIVDRNLNLGQIVTERVSATSSGAILSLASDPSITVTATGELQQYLSTHHYENSAGDWVDIDPETPVITGLSNVSFLEHYQALNEAARTINVIQEDVIAEVSREFRRKLAL